MEAGAVVRNLNAQEPPRDQPVTVSLVILIASATLVRNGLTLTRSTWDSNDCVVSVNQPGPSRSLIPRAAAMLAADPRVEAVAVTTVNPLFEQYRQTLVTPVGASSAVATRYTFVSSEYFPILQIPIERGRGFRADEAASEAPVGIISAATARAFWPDADPIGKTVRIEISTTEDENQLRGYGNIVIVGVAKDVVSGFVYDGKDRTHLYLPTSPSGTHAGALLVRGRTPAEFRRDTLPVLLERVHPDPFALEALRWKRSWRCNVPPQGRVVDRIAARMIAWPSACLAVCRLDLHAESTDSGARHPHGARSPRREC